MFSKLVNTEPDDFPRFVGNILGGTGVRRSLDSVRTFGDIKTHLSRSPSSDEEDSCNKPEIFKIEDLTGFFGECGRGPGLQSGMYAKPED